jgi:hypothetical protein
VDALREVWWEDSVYTRETPQYRDYYIHLINTPESEAADIKSDRDPPAVDDAEVNFKGLNPAKVQAWALRPYNYDSQIQEPVQHALQPAAEKDGVRLELPPFRYYLLLVVREWKARPQ